MSINTCLATAAVVSFFVCIIPAFEAQAAPAPSGPFCGITGTVDSVEFVRSESEFLGQPVVYEYYEVTLAPKTIHLPATSSLDAYADTLGIDRDEVVSRVAPETELSICKNAYGSRDTYEEGDQEFIYSEEYIYHMERYTELPIEEGQRITGLVEAGGDEALLGIFLKGVVVLEDSPELLQDDEQGEGDNTEKRTLQMRLIELLNQLLSLLNLGR